MHATKNNCGYTKNNLKIKKYCSNGIVNCGREDLLCADVNL